jgi:hypothetical protein
MFIIEFESEFNGNREVMRWVSAGFYEWHLSWELEQSKYLERGHSKLKYDESEIRFLVTKLIEREMLKIKDVTRRIEIEKSLFLRTSKLFATTGETRFLIVSQRSIYFVISRPWRSFDLLSFIRNLLDDENCPKLEDSLTLPRNFRIKIVRGSQITQNLIYWPSTIVLIQLQRNRVYSTRGKSI